MKSDNKNNLNIIENKENNLEENKTEFKQNTEKEINISQIKIEKINKEIIENKEEINNIQKDNKTINNNINQENIKENKKEVKEENNQLKDEKDKNGLHLKMVNEGEEIGTLDVESDEEDENE